MGSLTLDTPKISWYIETDDGCIPTNDYYAGSYKQGENVTIVIYLWNNRWGIADVMDISNLKLKVFFDKMENNILLKQCSYSIDNSSFVSLPVDNDIGYINSSKTIKGTKNDGSIERNPNNYTNIRITIPVIEGIVEALKTLYVSPLYTSGGDS